KPGTERPSDQRSERPRQGEQSEGGRGRGAGGGPGDRRDSRRSEGRRDGRRSHAGKQQRSGKGAPAQHRPKPKPKPVRPITPDMVDGKEPMRSFSDLMQFFEKKQDSDEDTGSKKKQ
ncbi:MAG: hypothetical protein EA424_27690, partial [Planctomycetaceae bacterium]